MLSRSSTGPKRPVVTSAQRDDQQPGHLPHQRPIGAEQRLPQQPDRDAEQDEEDAEAEHEQERLAEDRPTPRRRVVPVPSTAAVSPRKAR